MISPALSHEFSLERNKDQAEASVPGFHYFFPVFPGLGFASWRLSAHSFMA